MKYFKTQEVVSESTYNTRGERSLQLVDSRIQTFLDNLREALGRPITCNDWLWGGKFQWRGLRTSESEDFSQWSQHTFGRAIDFTVKGMTAQEVRDWIIQNRDLWWVKPITFLEEGKFVTWVHCDTRAGTNGNLWVWNIDNGKTKVFKRG